MRERTRTLTVSLVIETEPSLLTADCDVPGRLERLARMKSQPGGVSPSLATFYEVRDQRAVPVVTQHVFAQI